MISSSSWVARLGGFAHLSADDESLLSDMSCGRRCRLVDQSFIESKDAANRVLVIVDGMACKSRLLADGRRQILSYLFAGDMTSPEQLLVRQPVRPVSMLARSEIALLDQADMDELRSRPNICDALGRYSLMKEAIASEWQVNVGLRTAQERIAHLLCEMYSRLECIEHARNHVFRLSLTQAQIADSVALSAVHVNRVLMELRRMKILAMGNGVVAILDYERLCQVAGFDVAYLRCDRGPVPGLSSPGLSAPEAEARKMALS